MDLIQRTITRQLQSAPLLLVLTGTIPVEAGSCGRRSSLRMWPAASRLPHSAEVAGFLRPMDSMRGSFIERVERTETGGDGEVWVFVGPAYRKWANLATVAESMSPRRLNSMVSR